MTVRFRQEAGMYPNIDRMRTGERIRALMEERGLSVQEVREHLSLGCVQSIYHWLEGRTLPSLDNLYALSELLMVPMDDMICGGRRESTRPSSGAPV